MVVIRVGAGLEQLLGLTFYHFEGARPGEVASPEEIRILIDSPREIRVVWRREPIRAATVLVATALAIAIVSILWRRRSAPRPPRGGS